MKRIFLDLAEFGVTVTNTYVEEFDDRMMGLMVRRLVTHVAAEEQKPYVIKSPASWWQQFKQEVFPAWLTHKFPVRLKETKLDVKTLYPFLVSRLPREIQGPRVTIVVRDQVVGSFLTDSGIATDHWNWDVVPELLRTQIGRTCRTCGRSIERSR